MIEVRGLKKTFDGFAALDGADLSVPRGAVYGLVGPNGAGKTTLLRHLTGVYHQDSGSVTFDGQPVWENADVKARIASIPDDWFYFMQAGLRDMMRFYRGLYPKFDQERFEKLREVFALDEKRPLRRMSKGQQKQAAFWLALCTMPDYLILDEPVDGLDPVMRRQVWSLILQDVAERGTTVLVSSHNLRELEDVCDHVGVMSRGKLLLEHSLSELQDYTVKLQLAFEGAELPALPRRSRCCTTRRPGASTRSSAAAAQRNWNSSSPRCTRSLSTRCRCHLKKFSSMNWEVRTMRSATSFFDKTLFRSQLKHTWPLWLGYTALWLFLVPVALFSELSAYQGGYSAADASYLLLNTGVRGGIFISFFFGLFFAMLSFSHLTQSRATNGFHALPVRRETIFMTAYLTGLFCQLSTILVTFLLGAAVSAPLHLSFWSVTGAAMGSAMLEAVFFYSFAVLCMMMTGQILAAPVFYFVGNILVPGMEYLLRDFAGNFLYGYSGHTDVALGFLSPPLYMYPRVDIASIETCESDSYYVTAYALEHRSLMILAAYALAGLVIALIALLLYRTRKSEMTGSTVAFPWATPIFKYGVAFCTAVALGQFLYYFLFGQYRSGGSDSLPGTILCMAAAGLVGYFAAEMLIKKSFRVFRAGAKGAAIVAGVLVLLGIGMSFDLTGYEKHVPDESEIESVYYTFSGMTNVTTDDADTIRRLTAAHQAIVKNRNEQARIADAWDADTLSQSDHDDIEHFSLRLTYYLKDGSQLSRSYSLYLRRSDLTVPSSATARVNALYMCRESVLRRVLGYGCDHLGDTPRFLDSYCYYYDENSNTKDYALTAAQAEQVYAALMQDVQDSDNGGSDIFAVQEYQYDPPSFWLELYFESTNEKGRPEVYTLSPHVNGSTPNTLQVLNELLPELKSNTVTPPSDDGIHTLPATEDASTEESVN